MNVANTVSPVRARPRHRQGEGRETTLSNLRKHLPQPRLHITLLVVPKRVSHPCVACPTNSDQLYFLLRRKGKEHAPAYCLNSMFSNPSSERSLSTVALPQGNLCDSTSNAVHQSRSLQRARARRERGKERREEGTHCTTGSAVPWPWKTLWSD
jgi:hypothetical protein